MANRRPVGGKPCGRGSKQIGGVAIEDRILKAEVPAGSRFKGYEIRASILAIARRYEEADDLDFLRSDPAFKFVCGRLPDSGANLCSQPTLSRLENPPSLKDAIRLT